MRQVTKGSPIPHWSLVGIVSFGSNKCGVEKFPGIYTKMSKTYIDWVKETIRE